MAYRTRPTTVRAIFAGIIESPSNDAGQVAEAITLHGESPVHAQWATWQEAVHAMQRPTRKPCPCHAHVAEVVA